MDVLHHHDGIVDQDADGEYEGKEGDPVQGVAVEIGDEDGEGQGHRNGDTHHDRFPPAEGKGDEEGHRGRGDEHVLEQFVRLVFGGFAVVPRGGHLDA